ncbi:MAG: glycosyltransferase family 4 protein [Acidobacteriia bacterium]|nr:glycosyltransferase family 4 protein [Terriglobia bacterium]
MTATLSPPSATPLHTAPAPRRYRVLAVATHPVQYAAPVVREMARHPQLDLQMAYCSLQGAQAGVDPEFGVNVQWDMPLLEGYPWVLVPNRSWRPGLGRFFGLCNPGLWTLLRRGSFDAVILWTGYVCASFWIALLAAKLHGVAVLFGTDATTIEPRNGRPWKRALKKIVWPRLFRLADQVIVPSSGARDLMHSLGIPQDRVTLTPYSVDNDWWMQQSAKVDRLAVRAAWGATPANPVVLFCAKLQPWKRPSDLLRAFAGAALADVILVFAGEGPLRAQLEAETAALGLRDRVRFLGFVNQSQLPAIYTAADIMVLPSEYDAFAVVVNEAMCCGCPVITSDRVGAARDLVLPVRPEFVYPCGDVDALAHLLKTALADRASLERFGRAALARMRTWSPAQNIAATVEAVQRAVAHARPPAPHLVSLPAHTDEKRSTSQQLSK